MTKTKGVQPARDPNRTLRLKQAIDMRILGYEWEEIATQCGIKGGKGAAYTMVNNALRSSLREPSEQLRELELQRLDKLMQVQMKKAMDGNDWATDRVLHIMERRAKLLGLDIQKDAPTAGLVLMREYAPGVLEAV